MINAPDAAPLAFDRPDAVRRFGDVLSRVGYNESGIAERLGAPGTPVHSYTASDRHRIWLRCRDEDPLASFIRLFLCGRVGLDALRRAIAPADPAEWAELGLIAIDGTDAVRKVALLPGAGLIVASDLVPTDGPMRRDHVLQLSASTMTTARAMIDTPARRALDIGTGCGFQAFVAAAHCGGVLATDCNPRALAFARFNALLNGTPNVEFALGDLYEPALGARFDLIVSNPPFVVSPDDALVYRDSGMKGDTLCERVVREAPLYLEEGGFAQFLCNWIRPRGVDWAARLSSWFAGSGGDAWVLLFESRPVAAYAEHWLLMNDVPPYEELSRRFDRWMAYYDAEGIEAVDTGMILLRRRSSGAAHWTRIDPLPTAEGLTGAGLLRGIAGRDLLSALPDDRALLALPLRANADLLLEQTLKPGPAGWEVGGALCRQPQGPPFIGAIDQASFHILTLCRGRLPLGDVLVEMARRLGQEPEAILPAALEVVRSMIDQGFLHLATELH